MVGLPGAKNGRSGPTAGIPVKVPLPLAQITHEETVPVFVLNMQTSSHSIDKWAPGKYVATIILGTEC